MLRLRRLVVWVDRCIHLAFGPLPESQKYTLSRGEFGRAVRVATALGLFAAALQLALDVVQQLPVGDGHVARLATALAAVTAAWQIAMRFYQGHEPASSEPGA